MRTKRNHLHEVIVCITLGCGLSACLVIGIMSVVYNTKLQRFFDKVDNIETIVKKSPTNLFGGL